jgi:23S rRNA (cytidine1920-2'-O)/16S rRNA (cytidine1409-2'-O)-methyltransferase
LTRHRLDAELVRRGMARSREQAQELIAAGRVEVRGAAASKAATQIDDADPVEIVGDEDPWVSRGAHKLLGALAAFPSVSVADRRCLDAGASTGGFTQVLLATGAAHVIAVDVGYGQLAWSLQTDPRVTILDRTNVRSLAPDALPYVPDLVVADLSFISLERVLPALAHVAAPTADFLLMVKPQFEVGREDVGDGVVRDPDLRHRAVVAVAEAAQAMGLGVLGVAASPLPGPSGNVEYFLWLAGAEAEMMGRPVLADGLDEAVRRAIKEGPE